MTERRTEVAQRAPTADVDLAGFPTAESRGTTFYRAKRHDRGAWWFASTPADADGVDGGRFDLATPRGTCCWADSVEVAVRERLAHHTLHTNTVFVGRAREMVVVAARASRGRRFADVTAPDAVRHGVGAELQTMVDYRVPQAWARAFDAVGFAGVQYSTRFTSATAPNAWAVFGDAGVPRRPRPERVHRDGVSACVESGIRVLEDGSTAGPERFTIVPPPR
ncbi:RES family NAD+ phosphorylase [Curtobacterium sp. VKM Ac-1395]|uniref:RES family NAD+ phosphorylase n=1 Tax=Curtobacterium sp. VKM Ac-1395 TaxID=2783815 RepID=UPI00188DB93B|nr:RES family NAD+ phosphorylase [Curtobacterium sp. VKM Ac-1395]MBF4590371.1 RES family NAD+ phosphorylase [Curtobacterium sp. VKM Ac-1395]